MQAVLFSLAATCFLSFASAGLYDWNGLVTTWDLNPFHSYAFEEQAIQQANAVASGWELLENDCADGSSPFRGFRYWKNQDPALILIFDANGYVAGVQTALPKNAFTPTPQLNGHPYIDDGAFWTLTTYFADPNSICVTGATGSKPNLQNEKFFIQNGSNPLKDVLNIPLKEADVITTTKWTKGYCFWTMGQHYWYDITKDMDGAGFFPFFLLYNKGKLTGYGFAVDKNVPPSTRYEHPGPKEAKLFINPYPDFIAKRSESEKLSTMHVWMIKHPRFLATC